MAVQWFYLKQGWFKSKRIGPISESELLHRIDSGDVSPDTLILCDSKTRGHWLRMKEVAPAMKRWNKTHEATV